MNRYLPLLFALLSFFSYGQHSLYVIDAETHDPIPLAEIRDSSGFGALTDWEGKVEFPIANVILEIHALGYVDTSFLFVNDTLFLPLNRTVINEVFIYAGDEGPDTILGNPSEEGEFAFKVGKSFQNSFKAGLLIPIVKPTVLYDVNFYITRRTKRNSYYRIRIFSVELDEDTIVQINDIIDSSLVNQIDCRRCWQRIELPRELLVSNDVLIAMEWIPEPGWIPQDVEDDGDVELHDMACTLSESGYSCMTYNGMQKLIPQCWDMLDEDGDKNYNMALFVNARILD